jgi:hypothetical protein
MTIKHFVVFDQWVQECKNSNLDIENVFGNYYVGKSFKGIELSEWSGEDGYVGDNYQEINDWLLDNGGSDDQ